MEVAVHLEQLAVDMHWVIIMYSHSQGQGGCFESTSHMGLFLIYFLSKDRGNVLRSCKLRGQ